METVGDYLKKEREAKNISLRKVSHLTKISEFYLDCLENDDYEKLPQGPYIKGYISSYATLIGGNAEEALQICRSSNGCGQIRYKIKRGFLPSYILFQVFMQSSKNNNVSCVTTSCFS